MTALEKLYRKQIEIGTPIFEKFFNLKKEQLIKVLSELLYDSAGSLEILNNNPTVIKTLRDDEAEEIKICMYSTIFINCLGISYKPEHGVSKIFIKFTNYFDVEIINNILS